MKTKIREILILISAYIISLQVLKLYDAKKIEQKLEKDMKNINEILDDKDKAEICNIYEDKLIPYANYYGIFFDGFHYCVNRYKIGLKPIFTQLTQNSRLITPRYNWLSKYFKSSEFLKEILKTIKSNLKAQHFMYSDENKIILVKFDSTIVSFDQKISIEYSDEYDVKIFFNYIVFNMIKEYM